VEIYVATMQALKKKETQDETQFTTKIGGKTSLGPSYFLLYSFHSHLRVWCPIMRKPVVLAPWSPDFIDNSIISASRFVHKAKSLSCGHWQLDGFTRSVAKRSSPWIRWPSTMECSTTGWTLSRGLRQIFLKA
jgi:hypothetical protein